MVLNEIFPVQVLFRLPALRFFLFLSPIFLSGTLVRGSAIGHRSDPKKMTQRRMVN